VAKFKTYLIAHMPKQSDGKRAKSGRGMVGATEIVAKTEADARETFADLYPQREITALGARD
jgi:hypothetical protein